VLTGENIKCVKRKRVFYKIFITLFTQNKTFLQCISLPLSFSVEKKAILFPKKTKNKILFHHLFPYITRTRKSESLIKFKMLNNVQKNLLIFSSLYSQTAVSAFTLHFTNSSIISLSLSVLSAMHRELMISFFTHIFRFMGFST